MTTSTATSPTTQPEGDTMSETTTPTDETTTTAPSTAPAIAVDTDTPTAVDAPPTEPTETPDEAPATDVGNDLDTDTGNREAAKYRRKLRDAETELENVRGQVDAMRRAEVERVLKQERRPVGAAAIFAAGIEMSELLTEDGTVDTALVLAAVDKAGAALGIRVKLPAAPPATGQGNMGTQLNTGAPSWTSVLRG